MKKPKFDKWITDKDNAELRKRAKALNKIIHKKNKSDEDRIKLQKLLEEEYGQN